LPNPEGRYSFRLDAHPPTLDKFCAHLLPDRSPDLRDHGALAFISFSFPFTDAGLLSRSRQLFPFLLLSLVQGGRRPLHCAVTTTASPSLSSCCHTILSRSRIEPCKIDDPCVLPRYPIAFPFAPHSRCLCSIPLSPVSFPPPLEPPSFALKSRPYYNSTVQRWLTPPPFLSPRPVPPRGKIPPSLPPSPPKFARRIFVKGFRRFPLPKEERHTFPFPPSLKVRPHLELRLDEFLSLELHFGQEGPFII